MRRNTMILASLLSLVALVVGCGGGGGGGTTPPVTTAFVFRGTVQDTISSSPVSGATVKVDTYTATTNSQGVFSLSMPTRPLVQTFSVDGRAASPQCYTFWAKTDDGKTQDAQAIAFPATGTDMGVILLWNTDAAPPAPFYGP